MTAPMVASLTRLRSLLLRELASQAVQATECRTTVSSLTGQTDVDSVLEREIAEASANRADEAIADIEDALARLDNGSFGTCEQCGAAIPVERLEIVPHTRYCVDCPPQRSGLLG